MILTTIAARITLAGCALVALGALPAVTGTTLPGGVPAHVWQADNGEGGHGPTAVLADNGEGGHGPTVFLADNGEGGHGPTAHLDDNGEGGHGPT
jgi:hypothetical protein